MEVKKIINSNGLVEISIGMLGKYFIMNKKAALSLRDELNEILEEI